MAPRHAAAPSSSARRLNRGPSRRPRVYALPMRRASPGPVLVLLALVACDSRDPAPPPVELALRLDDGAGGWLPPLAGWHDGTGGMRRSGLIRFALPAGWAGRSEFALALSGGAQRLHAEPPRLAALAFGAGLAHHAVPLRIEDAPNGDPLHDALRSALVDQLVGWLPLSGCELALPHGLIPALETGLALVLQRFGWSLPNVPVGDSIVLEEAMFRRLLGIGPSLEAVDARFRQWPAACVSLLLIILALLTASLSGSWPALRLL